MNEYQIKEKKEQESLMSELLKSLKEFTNFRLEASDSSNDYFNIVCSFKSEDFTIKFDSYRKTFSIYIHEKLISMYNLLDYERKEKNTVLYNQKITCKKIVEKNFIKNADLEIERANLFRQAWQERQENYSKGIKELELLKPFLVRSNEWQGLQFYYYNTLQDVFTLEIKINEKEQIIEKELKYNSYNMKGSAIEDFLFIASLK